MITWILLVEVSSIQNLRLTSLFMPCKLSDISPFVHWRQNFGLEDAAFLRVIDVSCEDFTLFSRRLLHCNIFLQWFASIKSFCWRCTPQHVCHVLRLSCNVRDITTSHPLEEAINSILKVWCILWPNTSFLLVLPEHARNLDAILIITKMRLPIDHTGNVLPSQWFTDLFLHGSVIQVCFGSFLSQQLDLFLPIALCVPMSGKCICESSWQLSGEGIVDCFNARWL